MMEVFVAYTKHDSIELLEKTLEAWDDDDTEPVAIECKQGKFQIHRRVIAENLATGDYVLADIGYGPAIPGFAKVATELLEKHSKVGMIGQGTKGNPHSVVICRKGIITHWPTPRSETYIPEHVEAYRLKGYKPLLCQQRLYRQLESRS